MSNIKLISERYKILSSFLDEKTRKLINKKAPINVTTNFEIILIGITIISIASKF